jgi:hypothetical protein
VIFGFGLVAVGYAVFYWGLHHFKGADCPAPPGTDPNSWDGTGCRYSLVDLLGLPTSWGVPHGTPVAFNPPDTSTQAQVANNTTTGQGNLSSTGPVSSNGWVKGILQGLNAPQSINNALKLLAWNSCEGNLAGHSGLGINNPFNITADSYQPATHGDSTVNSAGVQCFSTMTAGIKGTLAKLNEPFAAGIKNNLVQDATTSGFANAVGASHWGTSGQCIAAWLTQNAALNPGSSGAVSPGLNINWAKVLGRGAYCAISCMVHPDPGCNCGSPIGTVQST